MYARQMRLLLSIFLVVFFNCSIADTVYKTVDENGNIIFTDKPSDDAEVVKIQKLENTIDNPNPAKYRPAQPKSNSDSESYETFRVSSPANGAGIRSNNGSVSISLSLEPGLKPGHKVMIFMDGKQVGSGMGASLQNVDRGTHSISAKVIDADGKVLKTTSSSFSLLRAAR